MEPGHTFLLVTRAPVESWAMVNEIALRMWEGGVCVRQFQEAGALLVRAMCRSECGHMKDAVQLTGSCGHDGEDPGVHRERRLW